MASHSTAALSSHSDSHQLDGSHERPEAHHGEDDDASASVPVEVLVEHLLAAKRSLSSMTLVLQANDLATRGSKLYEESVILGARTAFLRKGIDAEVRILLKIRRGLVGTYDGGKRDFKHMIKTLDTADAKLRATMRMLQETKVDAIFRPKGEEPRTLLSFVDEQSVDVLVQDLKDNVAEIQAAHAEFDGEIGRFEVDLRNLNKVLNSAPSIASAPSAAGTPSVPELVESLTTQSRAMAEHLTGLTRHFDMCVRAIRLTEGGAALAKRKAAESNQPSQNDDTLPPQQQHEDQEQPQFDPVSISGVIFDHLSPADPAERAEIISVVLQDSPEVPLVLAELTATLSEMQTTYTTINDLLTSPTSTLAAYTSTATALSLLSEISTRLSEYTTSSTTYLTRTSAEKQLIFSKLEEMDLLREFYEGYASAYDSLILEAERRKAVEAKIDKIWQKAKESVGRLVEGDTRDREDFRREVGEYVPGDLWTEMSGPIRGWRFVREEEREEGIEGGEGVERRREAEEEEEEDDEEEDQGEEGGEG